MGSFRVDHGVTHMRQLKSMASPGVQGLPEAVALRRPGEPVVAARPRDARGVTGQGHCRGALLQESALVFTVPGAVRRLLGKGPDWVVEAM